MGNARLYAVGDIHGHYIELHNLLSKLKEEGMVPDRDTLVFLGDYVDGGKETAEVVEMLAQLYKLHPHWVFLKGNHEDMMLDALRWNNRKYGSYNIWYGQGGKATLDSYRRNYAQMMEEQGKKLSNYEMALLGADMVVSSAHLDWMECLKLWHQTPEFYFVHAGFNPKYPIEEQTEEDLLWIRGDFYGSYHDFGKPVVFGHSPWKKPNVRKVEGSEKISCVGIDCMWHDHGSLVAANLTDPNNIQFTMVDSVDKVDVIGIE